jgi:hypothetical protein
MRDVTSAACSTHPWLVDKLWRFSDRSSRGDGMQIPQKRSRTARRASLHTCCAIRSLDGVHASRGVPSQSLSAALVVKGFHARGTCSFRRTDHPTRRVRTRIRLTVHVSLVLSARLANDEQSSGAVQLAAAQLAALHRRPVQRGARTYASRTPRTSGERAGQHPRKNPPRERPAERVVCAYARVLHHAWYTSWQARSDLTKAVLKRDIARCGQSGSPSGSTNLRMLQTQSNRPTLCDNRPCDNRQWPCDNHRELRGTTLRDRIAWSWIPRTIEAYAEEQCAGVQCSCGDGACSACHAITRVTSEKDVRARAQRATLYPRAACDRAASSWRASVVRPVAPGVATKVQSNRGSTVTFSGAVPFSHGNCCTATGALEPRRFVAAAEAPEPRRSLPPRALEPRRFSCATRCLAQPL